MQVNKIEIKNQIDFKNECIQSIKNNFFTTVPGATLLDEFKLSGEEAESFSSHWSHLVLDEYMADGGLYRYRRYGQFSVNALTGSIDLLPHEGYMQPSYINSLNGDVLRYFEPLEKTFVESKILHELLRFLTQVYSGVLKQVVNWNIRLHPYRILASDKVSGLPTPEGLHRDGVTFIASLLINRVNIEGGTTTITDSNKRILDQFQLTAPFDLMMSDDSKTMHEVSSVKSNTNSVDESYRDVLVIAFTKPDYQ